uniref:Uncharacterized protein n=1 Tax=Onchocerca volvulus TaxID=6282 RepID=A0A8R1TLF2_ONCVO
MPVMAFLYYAMKGECECRPTLSTLADLLKFLRDYLQYFNTRTTYMRKV